MFRRLIAIILVFSLIFSSAPFVYASEITSISSDAFRVSEEYAAQYPNGVIEFSTVEFDTTEGADDFDVIVVRRGGTSGKVEVDFKVIEITAKYGDDFSILMPAWYGYETLKKEIKSPTLLESALEENKNGFITSQKYLAENPDFIKTLIDQESVVEAIYREQPIIAITNEPNKEDYSVTEAAYMEPAAPAYKSSLHELRDEAMGKTSTAPLPVNSQMNIFDIEDPEQIKIGDALNTIVPGAAGHLVFEDGENYKAFKVRIKDDNIFEGPKQFMIGLFDPTGGAVLGDVFNATCNIIDNDEGAGQIIGFEQECYSAYPSEKKAEVIITRRGDINAYAKIEISTLSGSAKADEHYVPVMTDTMFLPGETSKKVLIPLLADKVSEMLSFEIVVTEDEKPTNGISRTTVNIMPEEENKRFTLMSANKSFDPLSIYDCREYIYYPGTAFGYEGSYGSDAFHTWNISNFPFFAPSGMEMPLNDGWGRAGYMYKWVDLLGISGITVDWRNTGDDDKKSNKSYIYIDDKEYYNPKGKFDETAYIGGSDNQYPRKNTKMRFVNKTEWSHYGCLGVRSIKLHKQQFPVVIDEPLMVTYDKEGKETESTDFTYNVWNGNKLVDSIRFEPGTVEPSDSKPYRDETISLTPKLSREGLKRGLEYIGYQVKIGNKFKTTVFSDKITIAPEFIADNIYVAGTTKWSEKLTIRPVFKRINAWSLKILDYDDKKGELRIDGRKHKNQIYDTSGCHFGDELKAELIPEADYSAKGIKYSNGNIDERPYANIVLNKRTEIEPVFNLNSKTITIEWRAPDEGTSEPKETNNLKGMILHDHPDNMPLKEKGVLYKDVITVTAPNRDDYQTDAEYQKALDEYRSKLAQNEAKIAENYSAYRQNFSTFTLEKLSVGDIVTLYAKPDKDYTVSWVIKDIDEEEEEDDDEGPISTEDETIKYCKHIGSSFSFEVTDELDKVHYYFTEVNNPGTPIFSGRVVQSKNTIKVSTALPINPYNDKTFNSLPGVSVSVSVADSGNTSIIKGNKKYETTTVTDKDGIFKLYAPYGTDSAPYSIKLAYDNKIYTKSIRTGSKTTYLEIPYMDNFKVEGMQITGISNEQLKIEDRTAKISLIAYASDNRSITKVRLRSYDALGTLWQTLDATSTDGREWTLSTNLRESFKNNGRLTVELYDDKNIRHGEIESGYIIEEPPAAGDVILPDIPGIGDGTEVNPIGQVKPETELGKTRSLQPQPVSDNAKTYAVAVGVGKTLKNIIDQNVDHFAKKNITQKTELLADYLNDGRYSSNLLNDSWNNSKGSSKTGPGKGGVTIDFDIGFYIQLTKEKKGAINNFYFDYAMIYVGCEAKAQQDITASICGVPVYLRIKGSASVRGLFMAQGGDDTRILTTICWFPLTDNYDGMEFYGLFHINAKFAIGAGLGVRGLLSGGIEGEMIIDIVYQPWNNGAGTLTFALNADIDVWKIPIKFNITKYTLQLFRTAGYKDSNWLPEITKKNAMIAANNIAKKKGISRISELDRAYNMSDWNNIPDSANAGLRGIEVTTLQRGIYKHPQPKIVSLNNNKKILFFINDDLERPDYDSTALYYSIYDGEWSEPVKLQDDGMADCDPYAKVVGDKILVTWSGSNRTFGDTQPSIADLLSSTDIYAQFFDLDGNKAGNTERLTFDNGTYGNATPKAAYDKTTGNIMLLYNKTDYKTKDVAFDGNALKIGDFLHNSYSTIAYRMYVNGKWQTSYYEDEKTYLEYEKKNGAGSLYGQRFMDFDLADVYTPKVTDFAAASQDGKAQIIYILDIDQNPETRDDSELFMMVYDFENRTFTSPIRITDDLTPDSNLQTIEYEGDSYLFWNNNGYISYIALYPLMNFNLSEETMGGVAYSKLKDEYESFLTVMDEKNTEAAESFTVTIGDDGNLYVAWNELGQTITNNVAVKERQLYAAMYDSKFETVYEGVYGEPVYRGSWGTKQQLSEIPGEYNNEQTVAVDSNGTVTVINRRFEIVDNTSTPDEWDKKESDTSALVARRFEPVSTLDIYPSDIKIYPEYPKAGDNVTLTVSAVNAGFMPSKEVTFKFEIYDDIVFDSHLSSGGKVTASTSFTMPDNFSADNPVKLKITAWEEDLKSSAAEEPYEISPQENIIIENQGGYLYSNDEIRITGTLLNLGNKDDENIMLSIEKFNDNAVAAIVKTLSFDTVKPSDIYKIDEMVKVTDADFGDDDSIEFYIKVKKTINDEETIISSKPVIVYKDTGMAVSISVNQPMSMERGTSQSMAASILPISAAESYDLQYKSLNPEIAEINSDGIITAKKAGTAKILVEAIGNIYLIDKNNKIYNPAGGMLKFNADGSIKNPADDIGSDKAAASRTVFVTVADTEREKSKDEEPNSSTTNASTNTPNVIKTIIEGNQAVIYIKENFTLRQSDIIAALNKLDKEMQPKSLKIVIEGDKLNIDKDALKALIDNDINIHISLNKGEIYLPKEVLEQIAARADSNIVLSINKTESADGRPIVDIEIKSGSNTITGFGGNGITIRIPYTLKDGEDKNAIVVYHVDENGKYNMITKGEYKDGFVTFKTNHLSRYAIGYNYVQFMDVSGWAKDYITYLAARGVINGIGDGRFVPNNKVTRAEFVKMLAVLSGDIIQEDAETQFSDFDKTAWYAPYVAWAAKNGYVLGTSKTTFAPNDKITREQIAVIIERFIKAKNYKLESQNEPRVFADEADISTYAKDAAAKLSSVSIISGKENNIFAPKENAARAECAKMLAALLSIILE